MLPSGMSLCEYNAGRATVAVDPSGHAIILAPIDLRYRNLQGEPWDVETWEPRVASALYKICPCVAYGHGSKREYRTGTSARIKKGRKFVRLVAEVTPGYGTEESFCKCVDQHRAGCTLIHDLLVGRDRVAIEYAKGEARFRKRRVYFDRTSTMPTPTLYTLYTVRWDDKEDWRDASAPSSTAVLALGHELFHAWTEAHVRVGNEWKQRISNDTLTRIVNGVRWGEHLAVRLENQLGREIYKNYTPRTTYPDRLKRPQPIVNPNAPVFGACKDCKEWFKELKTTGWR